MGPRTTPGSWRGEGRGYTLVALLVGLAVMMILIAAVLPTVSAEMQRAREEELIFRGTQYVEGIRVFRRKFGRYPNALKEMIEMRPRTIRKLWKDPMTADGEWGIVGIAAPLPGVGVPVPPRGGSAAGGATPVPTPTPDPFAGSRGTFGQPQGQLGPVMGVYSKSTKKGFRIFQGRENYNDWRFTEQAMFGTLPVPPGGSTTPGGGAGPGVGGPGPGAPR